MRVSEVLSDLIHVILLHLWRFAICIMEILVYKLENHAMEVHSPAPGLSRTSSPRPSVFALGQFHSHLNHAFLQENCPFFPPRSLAPSESIQWWRLALTLVRACVCAINMRDARWECLTAHIRDRSREIEWRGPSSHWRCRKRPFFLSVSFSVIVALFGNAVGKIPMKAALVQLYICNLIVFYRRAVKQFRMCMRSVFFSHDRKACFELEREGSKETVQTTYTICKGQRILFAVLNLSVNF